MRAKGLSGELRVGYQRAATLGAWSLEPSPPNGAIVTATIEDADEFWMDHEPKSLYLALGPSWWIWKHAELRGNQIHVTGTPETKER